MSMTLDDILNVATKSTAGEIAYRFLFELLYKEKLSPREIVNTMEKDETGIGIRQKYVAQLVNLVDQKMGYVGERKYDDIAHTARGYAVMVFDEMTKLALKAQES